MVQTNTEMKKFNMRKIFDVMRSEGALSRREIERLTGLSWGTVSAVCNELLKKEIIVAEKDAVYAGRPPERLTVNRTKNLSLGIDINSVGLNFDLSDLAGNPVFSEFVQIEDNSRTALLNLLECHTESIVAKYGEIISISLSMQGKLNKKTGISARTNFFSDWKNVDLVGFFEKKFGIRTKLYHDPECLLAYHLKTDPRIKGRDNGIAIRVDNGIGMAQIVNGKIYENGDETACELGHTISVPAGIACACGKRGCLETYSSIGGMKKRFEKESENSAVGFITAFFENDPAARNIYREATVYLGIAVANLFTLLTPSFILLDGAAFNLLPDFFKDVKKETERYGSANYELLEATYKKDAPALGAIYMTVDKIAEEILFHDTLHSL